LRKNGLDDPCVFKYHFTNITLGMRAKISIVFLSISLIASFGLTSNQAFAGNGFPLPQSCEDCDILEALFEQLCAPVDSLTENGVVDCIELARVLETCTADFCPSVGGVFEGVDTTSLLVSGAQMNAAWMIPVIVSGIGIAIVIARKF